jgi:hypothetical protein
LRLIDRRSGEVAYGCISTLVHTLLAVLAFGFARAHCLPFYLALEHSISDCRYHAARRIRAARSHFVVARAAATRTTRHLSFLAQRVQYLFGNCEKVLQKPAFHAAFCDESARKWSGGNGGNPCGNRSAGFSSPALDLAPASATNSFWIL